MMALPALLPAKKDRRMGSVAVVGWVPSRGSLTGGRKSSEGTHAVASLPLLWDRSYAHAPQRRGRFPAPLPPTSKLPNSAVDSACE